MSTILEALKKSERERKLDKVPTLGTMRPPEERRSTGFWVVLSSFMICVTAGVVAWLYLSPSAETLPPIGQAAGVQPVPAAAPEARSVMPAARPAEAVSPDPAPVSVVEFRNLPRSVADQLPELTVSVISWSGESDRNFVMMDSGIYRVGDVVADGLVLEEIEPDAAILDYLGQKIRIRP
jgi:hypothetical protein